MFCAMKLYAIGGSGIHVLWLLNLRKDVTHVTLSDAAIGCALSALVLHLLGRDHSEKTTSSENTTVFQHSLRLYY